MAPEHPLHRMLGRELDEAPEAGDIVPPVHGGEDEDVPRVNDVTG